MIALNFDKKLILIGNTEYSGEMKKGVFTIESSAKTSFTCTAPFVGKLLAAGASGSGGTDLGRVALGMGAEDAAALREIGRLLAYLREPEPPKGLRDAWEKLPILKQVLAMQPKVVSSAPSQEVVREGKDVDLGALPVQTCWPGDAGPLITWGLTVTRGPSTVASTAIVMPTMPNRLPRRAVSGLERPPRLRMKRMVAPM